MRIVILYNEVRSGDSPDELDVLVQVKAVASALARRGHLISTVACSLNLESARIELAQYRPDVVFNLVEALGGSDRLAVVATVLLDALGIPYTGCRSRSMLATSDKIELKWLLRSGGLPTPDWQCGEAQSRWSTPAIAGGRFIIKAQYDHASIGMDDSSVVDVTSADELAELIRQRESRSNRPHFAERFVDGREFNLSMIQTSEGGRVLPPAEIDFSTFPAGKPRIVGFDAKWNDASPEYLQTTRIFEFPHDDEQLLERLRELALRCWSLFEIRGFARIDYRVDGAGNPWMLEINTNPCLSPDAGFAAALERAEIPFDEAMEMLVMACLKVEG